MKNKACYAITMKFHTSQKLCIFPKGLTHDYGQKFDIFPSFFCRQYRPEKCPLRYSKTNKRHLRLEKQEVPKVEKLAFFQRG